MRQYSRLDVIKAVVPLAGRKAHTCLTLVKSLIFKVNAVLLFENLLKGVNAF